MQDKTHRDEKLPVREPLLELKAGVSNIAELRFQTKPATSGVPNNFMLITIIHAQF